MSVAAAPARQQRLLGFWWWGRLCLGHPPGGVLAACNCNGSWSVFEAARSSKSSLPPQGWPDKRVNLGNLQGGRRGQDSAEQGDSEAWQEPSHRPDERLGKGCLLLALREGTSVRICPDGSGQLTWHWGSSRYVCN